MKKEGQNDIIIMGIMVDHRAVHAPEVQQVLTRYGSKILMRSGIPDPGKRRGIITLTMQADKVDCSSLERDLKGIDGVSVGCITLADALDNFSCPGNDVL